MILSLSPKDSGLAGNAATDDKGCASIAKVQLLF